MSLRAVLAGSRIVAIAPERFFLADALSMRALLRLLPLLLLTTIAFSCIAAAAEISLKANPNPAVPLAAIAEIDSETPTRVELHVTDGDRGWNVSLSEYKSRHEVPVLGMRPAREHSITATLISPSGNVEKLPTQKYATPGLPYGLERPFPHVQIVKSKAVTTGEVTISPVHQRGGLVGEQAGYGLLVGLNSAGEIVWYYESDFIMWYLLALENGNLHIGANDGTSVEIDLLGNVVRSYKGKRQKEDKVGFKNSFNLDTEAIHHEALELPSGNLLITGLERTPLPEDFPWKNAPAPGGGEASPFTSLGADEYLEITPAGDQVRKWKVLDWLDPGRVSYESNMTFYNNQGFYPREEEVVADWSHGNGLAYDESNRTVILSFRHIDCAIGVSYPDGELKWILGDPDGWTEPLASKLLTPVDAAGNALDPRAFPWTYHQHAPEVTPQGTLMFFDNGNTRAIWPKKKPEGQPYSRIAEFRIDEQEMTVELADEYFGWPELLAFDAPGKRWFSSFNSDVQQLTNGNVVISQSINALGLLDQGVRNKTASGFVAEVDWTTKELQLLFRIGAEQIDPKAKFDPAKPNWSIGQARRIPSLYFGKGSVVFD